MMCQVCSSPRQCQPRSCLVSPYSAASPVTQALYLSICGGFQSMATFGHLSVLPNADGTECFRVTFDTTRHLVRISRLSLDSLPLSRSRSCSISLPLDFRSCSLSPSLLATPRERKLISRMSAQSVVQISQRKEQDSVCVSACVQWSVCFWLSACLWLAYV